MFKPKVESIVFFFVFRPYTCACLGVAFNVKGNHKGRLTFDRLFVSVFLRLV